MTFGRPPAPVPCRVTSVVIGAGTIALLEESLGAAGCDFSSERWSKLGQANALPVEYPQGDHNSTGPLIHGDVKTMSREG